MEGRLGKQKAEIMSICSGRRKQQVLLTLAQDLLLSKFKWSGVSEGVLIPFHAASGFQGMNSITLITSQYLCIFETGDRY